ncbi:MAG: transposase, partial [Candidatus Aenigmatarchaeota archaeon]
EHVVKRVRNEYDEEVPIVLTADIGFFDQENFQAFEKLDIGYVVGGKLYPDIEEKAEQVPESNWSYLNKEDGRTYKLLSFTDRRESWRQSRRAIYTRLVDERNLKPLPFAQTRRVYYTNLGRNEELNTSLVEADKRSWLTTTGVVKLAHGRGDDELTHRSLKEFGTEKLPFQNFEPNTAFYYIMVFAFNLEEAFKRDVTKDQVSPVCYPLT